MKKRRFVLASLAALGLLGLTQLTSCGTDANLNDFSVAEDYIDNKTALPDGWNVKTGEKVSRNIYCAPDAKGSGTKEDPADFASAVDSAQPGDNFLLAAGVYNYETKINVGGLASEHRNQGTALNFVTIKPEVEGTDVIFDFSKMSFDGNNRGIQIHGDFFHVIGIQIRGAGDNGLYIDGSHNVIENCSFYNNRDSGLQLGRGDSGQTSIESWPSYNLIKNCTSFDNYDDETFGENADGFAAKLTIGYGNVFDGCMAFRNSDDGWDLYAKSDSGCIGTVIMYNCVSFENGILSYQIPNNVGKPTYDTMNGDGIGFKLGGSTMEGDVIMYNCQSFNNKLHGIGDNSNPGVLSINNCTTVNNCAGFDPDGTISPIRGLQDGTVVKSDNINLARDANSYNNYYGILSYTGNQNGYTLPTSDSTYNQDKYKGATAYSIFNTAAGKYTAFTAWEDASVYKSDSTDASFSYGSEFKDVAMNDDIFVPGALEPYNAVCSSVADLGTLTKFNTLLRNDDWSINMGDHLKLKNEKLLTYCEGNPVGAVLNKSSYAEYEHFGMESFQDNTYDFSAAQVAVLTAATTLDVTTQVKATYQDFQVASSMFGTSIEWKSSDETVLNVESNTDQSMSGSVYHWVRVIVPEVETKVTLTAVLTSTTDSSVKTTKDFEITVKPRKQALGGLTSTKEDVIRVELYNTYKEPRIYAIDDSSITKSELPMSLYNTETTFKYAQDGNSRFYPIDGVYTSVPGVYEITTKATSTADKNKSNTYVYHVYVVDPDCEIDFTEDAKVTLSSYGFVVTGKLSNISGYVVAYTSKTEDPAIASAQDIIAKADHQRFEISTDSVVASFNADNSSDVGATQYYIYYSVINTNATNNNQVYKSVVTVKNVNTEQEFNTLAKTGKLGGDATPTTIYSLTKDLDYSKATWNNSGTGDFTGLFRGNNHTISNLHITANEKKVNVFYRLYGGTIMDINLDNCSFIADNNESNGYAKTSNKQVGFIGAMVGGYVTNIHATRISAFGNNGVGAIIGAINGGINTVNNCSLVNPIPEIEKSYYTFDGTSYTPVTNPTQAELSTYYDNKYSLTEDKDVVAGKTYYTFDEATLTYNVVAAPTKDEVVGYYELVYYKTYDTTVQATRGCKSLAEFQAKLEYKISAFGKYSAGIVGNLQKDASESIPTLTMMNNFVSAVIGDGNDSGGCAAMILGRTKSNEAYTITLVNNVAYGTVIAKGQYTGGILGSVESGDSNITAYGNFADVEFIYNARYLNARDESVANNEQHYAHKNSSPIIGRGSVGKNGSYTTYRNIGSWTEYYTSSGVNSRSIVFDFSDYALEGHFYLFDQDYLKSFLQIDFDNTWSFDEEAQVLFPQVLKNSESSKIVLGK